MSLQSLDPRRHAFRPDLAAEALRGRVAATNFAAGEARQMVHSATPVRGQPDVRAAWTTEALFGERVTVYEERDGWAWVQLESDDYVGYVRAPALSAQVRPATHRVKALGSFIYPAPDVKSPPWMPISMNAALAVAEMGATFARLEEGGFVPARHLAEQSRFAPDFVGVAEGFAGVPYLWGGRTRLGIDCSGLLQTAMHRAGLPCPRDSDMQAAEIGEEIAVRRNLDGLARGDLVFWKGHVGIMIDPFLLLHANAHHMAVVIEPLSTAIERISRTGSAVTTVKRPQLKRA